MSTQRLHDTVARKRSHETIQSAGTGLLSNKRRKLCRDEPELGFRAIECSSSTSDEPGNSLGEAQHEHEHEEGGVTQAEEYPGVPSPEVGCYLSDTHAPDITAETEDGAETTVLTPRSRNESIDSGSDRDSEAETWWEKTTSDVCGLEDTPPDEEEDEGGVNWDEVPIVHAICCIGNQREWTDEERMELEIASRSILPDSDEDG